MGENEERHNTNLKPPNIVITKLKGNMLPRLLVVKETLGRGAYSTVVSARPIGETEQVAIKFTKYENITSPQAEVNENNDDQSENDDDSRALTLSDVLQESDILKSVQHEYIISWLGDHTFKSTNMFCLVMEIGKVHLWKLFHGNKPQPKMEVQFISLFRSNEEVVMHFMAPILDALIYLHEKNIVHRDIKVTNILVIIDKDKTVIPKLADFGSAIILPDGCDHGIQRQYSGSPYFVPYEAIIQGKISAKADIWAFGLSLVTLMGKSIAAGFHFGTWAMVRLYYLDLASQRTPEEFVRDTDYQLCSMLSSWGYKTFYDRLKTSNFSGIHLILFKSMCILDERRSAARELVEIDIVKKALMMWRKDDARDKLFSEIQQSAVTCLTSGQTLHEIFSSIAP